MAYRCCVSRIYLRVLSIVATFMIYLTMRETQKYHLDEFHRIVEVSTRNLASYRLCVELLDWLIWPITVQNLEMAKRSVVSPSVFWTFTPTVRLGCNFNFEISLQILELVYAISSSMLEQLHCDACSLVDDCTWTFSGSLPHPTP